MERYCHRSDALIDRNHPDHPSRALLYDCDGNLLFTFDLSWSDEQIYAALEFANRTYDLGFRTGAGEKAREIRRALGCDFKAELTDLSRQVDEMHRVAS